MLAVLLVLSMVSACTSGPRSHVERRLSNTPPTTSPTGKADQAAVASTEDAGVQQRLSDRQGLVPAAHRSDRGRYGRSHRTHYHEEPSPETKALAEAALILTGSVFLCTFVVVVLDGACEFGVGFGYHYY